MAKKKESSGGLGTTLVIVAVVVGLKVARRHSDHDDPAPLRATTTTECFEVLSSPPSVVEQAKRTQLRGLDRETAEELATEALLKVCSVKPDARDLRPYYFRAVTNQLNDHYRRRTNSFKLQDRLLSDAATVGAACPMRSVDPLEGIGLEQAHSFVEQWVGTLTDKELRLLAQHGVQGLSFREIELQTGEARSTLSDRWNRMQLKISAQRSRCGL